MTIVIINGPNLNLTGRREPEIYGTKTFAELLESLKSKYPKVNFIYFQSNHEGELIDKLQECGFSADGIVLNAGAFAHTSIALGDTIKAISAPVIEIHLSNVFAREDYRQYSFIAPHVQGCIYGMGMNGYNYAVEQLIGFTGNRNK